jgi:hypothetical protein
VIGYPSGLQEPLDTGFHVVVVDQFTAIGLFDAATGAGTKVSVLFYQSQSCILQQLFGAGASAARDSQKLRFLFGSELPWL